MPIALVFIGLIFIVSGARDTYRQLGAELIEDFTGPGNFLYWMLAIGFLGGIGTIPQFRTFSRAFMALILVSMLIANRGFASKLSEALASGPVNPEAGDNAKLVGASSTSDLANVANTNYLDDAAILARDASNDAQQNFGRTVNVLRMFFV